MDATISPRTSADGDCYAVTSSCGAASGRPDGAAGVANVVALGKGLARSGNIAESPKTAPVALPQAMSGPYPPAFDRDVMRWMPVIVPLLGVSTALLTGLMWMVVG